MNDKQINATAAKLVARAEKSARAGEDFGIALSFVLDQWVDETRQHNEPAYCAAVVSAAWALVN